MTETTVPNDRRYSYVAPPTARSNHLVHRALATSHPEWATRSLRTLCGRRGMFREVSPDARSYRRGIRLRHCKRCADLVAMGAS